MTAPARSTWRVLLLATAVAGLAGCGRGADTGTPRVALVLKTLNSPFFIDLQAGAEAAAARLGVTLVVQAAEREMDVEKQMQIIENLVQTGIDALCVAPSGSKEIVPALARARRAGIPIVVVDERINDAAASEAGVRPATFVGSDNADGGHLAGRHLIDVTGGRANVAVLEGIPGHESGDERLRGFREAIRHAPDITVVASQTANWERDQGFTVFQNMLQAHPEIDAVFACNDVMALGAVEAIAAAGRTGSIRVIGFDAVNDARAAIAAGTMDASVAQFPSEMGRLAVESAVKLLRGETVPAEQPTKVELVTRATLETSR
jgi:ribose transport system substrate-binding protein